MKKVKLTKKTDKTLDNIFKNAPKTQEEADKTKEYTPFLKGAKRKVYIITKIANCEKLHCLSLRSDIKDGKIFGNFLFPCGKISNEPETFAIDCKDEGGYDVFETYLYESELEYNEDLKILGLIS